MSEALEKECAEVVGQAILDWGATMHAMIIASLIIENPKKLVRLKFIAAENDEDVRCVINKFVKLLDQKRNYYPFSNPEHADFFPGLIPKSNEEFIAALGDAQERRNEFAHRCIVVVGPDKIDEYMTERKNKKKPKLENSKLESLKKRQQEIANVRKKVQIIADFICQHHSILPPRNKS